MDADEDDFFVADAEDMFRTGENDDILTQWEEMLPPCQYHDFCLVIIIIYFYF